MNQRRDYNTEAIKLSKAIDVAIESFKKYPPIDFGKENSEHYIKIYSEWKDQIINPLRKFKTLASLKYDIESVFTFFQESEGEIIEYFWKQLDKENLGYTREDKLRKIITRGKIKGRVEYEYVVDLIVAAEQENRITKEESKSLSAMIGKFENR